MSIMIMSHIGQESMSVLCPLQHVHKHLGYKDRDFFVPIKSSKKKKKMNENHSLICFLGPLTR